MKLLGSLLLLISFGFAIAKPAFINTPPSNAVSSSGSSIVLQQNKVDSMSSDPICKLPGDPSLYLVTNVDLGDKKLEIMKGSIIYATAVLCS